MFQSAFHEVGAHVQILQVVRVLPRVEHEQVDARLPDVALVVVDLLDVEALAEGAPTPAHPILIPARWWWRWSVGP
jgi:hypothetical protein